ncbi:MAG: hypothetical protein ACXWRE_16720 [Pseudobdellovibrionaceae bacterium]
MSLWLAALINIFGSWQFYAYVYEGREIPAPNPFLSQIMEFTPDGICRLYYKREDENGFCERKATYHFANGELLQKVVWVNPENQSSCGQDPDMQMGRVTTNKARIVKGIFQLDIPLSEETITYLWKRLPGPHD